MQDQPQTGGFVFDEGTVPAADLPVHPPAASKMNIDVTVNDKSEVWVIHDQAFPDYLEWVEFDVESGVMTFVTPGGKIQDLGLTIHPPMSNYVARAKDVCAIWVQDKEICDINLVPLTVRYNVRNVKEG